MDMWRHATKCLEVFQLAINKHYPNAKLNEKVWEVFKRFELKTAVGMLKYIRRRLHSSGHRTYSGDRETLAGVRARLPAAADKELAARGSITLRRWRLWKLVIGTARNQSGSAATPTHWSIVLCGRDDVKTIRGNLSLDGVSPEDENNSETSETSAVNFTSEMTWI